MCRSHHLLCHPAERQSGKPRSPSRADDDEIGAQGVCLPNYGRRRGAVEHLDRRVNAKPGNAMA
jgi:hypothetical protein